MYCDQNLNKNMCCNAFQPQPIIMPTQVWTRQRVACVEQPIIFPIECRTVNRVILVPRVYRAFSNSCMNTNNCTINANNGCFNRQ